ncbi:MAG: sortase [Cellulomonadaceae bacterium]|nr:sortase [Cellulomonadaceae bacterium]
MAEFDVSPAEIHGDTGVPAEGMPSVNANPLSCDDGREAATFVEGEHAPDSPAADESLTNAAPADNPLPRPKRGRLRMLVGWGMIAAALVPAGMWAWQVFGTTHQVREVQVQELAAQVDWFDSYVPPRAHEVADVATLCTDFNACPPPVVDVSKLETGDAIGILTIPSWEGEKGAQDEDLRNRVLVKEGSTEQDATTKVLDTGAAAHYVGSNGPGEVGNFAVSAHRRTYGDNFLHLPDLKPGHWVIFEAEQAWYVYRVIDHEVVKPSEYRVVMPDPYHEPECTVDEKTGEQTCTQNPTKRLITMTTCTAKDGSPWNNTHRWVVRAELYGWMYRKDGTPPMIDHYWVGDTDEVKAKNPVTRGGVPLTPDNA